MQVKNSILSNVSKGKIKKSHFVLIFGPDGVGKSTFAADAPNPIFIGSEDGTANLDVSRFPRPETLQDVFNFLNVLQTEPHDYKTLVIDSLDWLEPIIWKKVCKDAGKNLIEDVGGGYGKGYIASNDEWRELIKKLLTLRDKGMNIVLIAHSMIKPFTDPSKNAIYDRYVLKLNEKAAAICREAVDAVLFANYEVFVKGDPDKKVKAYGDGARVIFTERRPSFDAKNRSGLPFQLPLSWTDYESANKNGSDPTALKNSILSMTSELSDEELKKKVIDTVEKAGMNTASLEKILNRLNTIIEG